MTSNCFLLGPNEHVLERMVERDAKPRGLPASPVPRVNSAKVPGERIALPSVATPSPYLILFLRSLWRSQEDQARCLPP